MSKLRIVLVALVASSLVAVVPASADSGCKTGKFIGTYTSVLPNQDIFGDQTVFHTFLQQLTLYGDGNAEQYFTGNLDYMINTGSGSPQIGSWGCRKDGKLVVTFLAAGFNPIDPSANANTPNPDIALAFHRRATYVFAVTDDNTLTRVQARNRNYAPNQDPTDPAGGSLRPLNTTQVVYKRLVASDADVLLP